MDPITVLGLSGSLRAKSLNRSGLLAAGELMPPGMQLSMGDLEGVPLFNQDVQDQGFPPAVLALADRIRSAHGLVLASPEYNFSVSGVLKNAIDWLSRVPQQPFKDKPVALMSVTPGPVGGARHQYELRKILGALEAIVMPKPEVFIGLSASRFDAAGALTDPATRKLVSDQMAAFALWIRRVAPR